MDSEQRSTAGFRREALRPDPLVDFADAELQLMITALRGAIAEQDAIKGQAPRTGHEAGLIPSDRGLGETLFTTDQRPLVGGEQD